MPKKKVGSYAYDKDEILGAGQYGKVYQAEQIGTKIKVAVKVLDKEKINEDQYTKNALLREIEIMKNLKSPNIINFLEVHETKNNIYIFQQLASDGTLKDLLAQEERIDEQRALFFITQLVVGFGQLAKHGIIHRDVKPANILLKGNILKLADFGFARYSQNMSFMNSIVGSPAYMSPQVLNRDKYQNYSYKCDVWSFGIVCYELVVGEIPWEVKSNNVKELCQEIQKQAKIGVSFPSKVNVSPQLKELIQGCLRFEEKNRYDWTQIFQHPVFKNKIKCPSQIDNQLTIEQAFALTRLRMSIHAQNLNITQIFDKMPQKIDFQSFCIALKIMDQSIQDHESKCIFKSISKGKDFLIQKDLLKHFETHGIKLNGMKFSNVNRMKSMTFNEADRVIQELGLTLEQKNIEIESLFQKHDKHNRGLLDFKQFSGMIMEINPKLKQEELLEIFKIFDHQDKKNVSLKTCVSILCKLMMIPNVKDKNLKESIQQIKKKTL